MKKIELSSCALIVVMLCTVISSQLQADEDKWYRGGTLNQATVSEWVEASSENKLATAADWLAATLWKGKLTSLSDFDKLKVKSQMLADAIDQVLQGQAQGLGNTKALEIAAAIVTMTNDLGP